MYMSTLYNLYNFEAPFKNYLLAVIKPAKFDKINEDRTSQVKMANVSIKNYLSDFRHFTGFVTSVIASDPERAKRVEGLADLITSDLVIQYKNYLEQNNIPFKTINRRLSTIRKFCTFCISQGWLKENVAKKVTNITLTTGESKDLHRVLTQFHEDNPITDLADIREFFTIINS